MRILLLCLLTQSVVAQPRWLGHFNEHSLIQLDQQVLRLVPGQQSSGVRLLSRSPQGVRIEWQGRQVQLPPSAPASVIQTRGTRVAGRIGPVDVNWQIDTGSSDLVISQVLADRVGLATTQGRKRLQHSAGVVSAWVSSPQAIDVGPWRLPPQALVVVPGRMPEQPLFGLSGLSLMDLRLQGLNLTLQPLAGSGIIPAPDS